MNYTLISSSRNEEKLIGLTLDSVTCQTQLPARWIIVDDGSTDRTGDIADGFAKNYSWIRVVHRPQREGRSFGAKANNVNAAFAQLEAEGVEFDAVGNLDTDTSFAADYMEFLVQKLAADPKLGCVGTPFTQDGGYDSVKDSYEGENYVAGPIQLFRRDCFREIGGYVANPAGGVDWIAVMTARMKGWTVRSFADKRYHHHRSMGTAERNQVVALFTYGEKDYYLGNSPVWELFRVPYRMAKRPYVVGGIALLCGFCWAALRRLKRPVSVELMKFHRADQMIKLKNILSSASRLKPVEQFPLGSQSALGPAGSHGFSSAGKVSVALENFVHWLEQYGPQSWDHQSFYAGPLGRRAKGLYYRHKWLGTMAVAPMVFSEALFPPARRLFHHPIRLPIADAHYAMGFSFLYEATGRAEYLEKAVGFLEVLKESRSPGFDEYCWGYPFDWVTSSGVFKAHTPFITTTPYVFEALLQVNQLRPRDEWKTIMASTVRYATTLIKDKPYAGGGSTCSYMPEHGFNVVNAAAYRATMLVSAAKFFGNEEWLRIAAGNVDFVLAAQNPDGSWFYAKDGTREFVDHFHTCFVMKSLAKIHRLNGDARIRAALAKGVDYYLKNLFGEDGMPRPFSKAPRLTVYQCELYDCAECINLCLLLRTEFPQLTKTMETVVAGILEHWIKPDGSFRSRKLKFGWDNVPMHRWAQSQMFRALAFHLRELLNSGSSRKNDRK